MCEMMKTKLLSIDAWRDDYSWTWNNWYLIEDDIYIPENITNRELIRFMRDKLNIINNNSKGKVTIDDDGYNLVLTDRNTGEPLFALCYGEYQD